MAAKASENVSSTATTLDALSAPTASSESSPCEDSASSDESVPSQELSTEPCLAEVPNEHQRGESALASLGGAWKAGRGECYIVEPSRRRIVRLSTRDGKTTARAFRMCWDPVRRVIVWGKSLYADPEDVAQGRPCIAWYHLADVSKRRVHVMWVRTSQESAAMAVKKYRSTCAEVASEYLRNAADSGVYDRSLLLQARTAMQSAAASTEQKARTTPSHEAYPEAEDPAVSLWDNSTVDFGSFWNQVSNAGLDYSGSGLYDPTSSGSLHGNGDEAWWTAYEDNDDVSESRTELTAMFKEWVPWAAEQEDAAALAWSSGFATSGLKGKLAEAKNARTAAEGLRG